MGDISSPRQNASALSVGKIEDIGTNPSASAERSSPSGASSPDPEHIYVDHEQEQEPGPEPDQPQEHRQQQKRKGGRKPIYATSEERKQRNRQAQAAFRERRTEYIKQLESTIKLHEENLQNLQQSHRNAADECLMLRYKNSLLERILIEKGIDVQAELRAKTGSPTLGPTRVPSGPASTTPASQPIPRFPTGKFGANRRPLSGILTPKPDGVIGVAAQQLQDQGIVHTRSPLARPITASQMSSPNVVLAKSPNFLPQGGTVSPSFGPVAQQTQQLRPQQQQQSQQLRPQFSPSLRTPILTQHSLSSAVSSASAGSTGSSALNSASASNAPGRDGYYPSPFKNHYDQLEQEYDAQADMVDDQDPQEASAGPVPPFPTSSFGALPPPPNLPPQNMPHGSPLAQPNHHNTPAMQPQQTEASTGGQYALQNGIQQGGMFDHFDPMMDADPFGLTASMHFPTQYTFESQR